MQSYLYNDSIEPHSYSDDERYDEEDDSIDDIAINGSNLAINGKIFAYPSYDECEDMM